MTQKNFQEPLACVKGLGSAHDGVHHWIYQRISAVALIFLSLWMVYNLSHHVADDFDTVTAWLANPWNSAGVFLFITITTYHASLGIQIIIEDYIPASFWRYGSLLLVKLSAISIPALSLFLLVRITLWGLK